MTDRPDVPEQTPEDPAPPEEEAVRALRPGIWVSGLIALVILLLAAFAWT